MEDEIGYIHPQTYKPKPRPCLNWRWTRITCSLGFMCIIAAIISRFVMPMFVQYQIFTNLPLVEGEEAFENWKRPPVTPTMSLYVFNFTNTQAFLAGHEKPKLDEIGPFVYRQKMIKTDVEFGMDGESVSHSVYREHYFEASLSSASEDDYVIVPNIPLFGLIKTQRYKDALEKSITRDLLESYGSEGIDYEPFIKIKAKELFWGYPSILLSMQRQTENVNCSTGDDDFFRDFDKTEDEETENCDIVAGNLVPFGLFSTRNATSLDIRTVKTGKSQPFEKGQMVAWHGQEKLDYWSSEQCNTMTGRDPSGLPLLVTRNDKMNLFIGQMCRPLIFQFQKEVRVDDEFEALRFVPEVTSLSGPDQVPENQCYCLSDPCLPSGLLDISGCQKGSPVYLSWPHFLHGDPNLVTSVQGLSPDEEKHSFIIDMLPKYGVALTALARLQLNVMVEKYDGFEWFSNISQDKVYLPVVWLEEGVSGPSDFVRENVRFLYGLPEMVANLQTLGLMVLGLILLIPEIILWSRQCFADLR